MSIACCFIHKEVKIEIYVILHNLFKNSKFMREFTFIKCLNAEYINSLKYMRENRNKLQSEFTRPRPAYESTNLIAELGSGSIKPNLNKPPKRKSSMADSITSFGQFCCCLFSNQKNDFYQPIHRRSTTVSAYDRSYSKINILRRLKSRSASSNTFSKRNISEISFKPRAFDLESSTPNQTNLNEDTNQTNDGRLKLINEIKSTQADLDHLETQLNALNDLQNSFTNENRKKALKKKKLTQKLI